MGRTFLSRFSCGPERTLGRGRPAAAVPPQGADGGEAPQAPMSFARKLAMNTDRMVTEVKPEMT